MWFERIECERESVRVGAKKNVRMRECECWTFRTFGMLDLGVPTVGCAWYERIPVDLTFPRQTNHIAKGFIFLSSVVMSVMM